MWLPSISILLNYLNNFCILTRRTMASNLAQVPYNTSGLIDTIGGYNYRFFEGIEDQNICKLCNFAMRDAVQTECGHHFCHSCITNYIRTNTDYNCPVCGVRYDSKNVKVFNDDYMRNRIMSKQVHCRFANCPYIAPISVIEYHIKSCDYGLEITCQYCNQLLMGNQKLSHIETCPKMPIQCPHNCHQEFPRELLLHHEGPFNDSCVSMTRHCPYSACEFTGKLHELQDHLRDSALVHATYHQNQVSVLSQQIKMLEDRCSENKAEIQKTGQLQLALEQNCYGSKLKISAFIRSKCIPFQGEDWEHYAEFINFPTDGKMVWVIRDFRDTFQSATNDTMVYSTPFYINPIGFKLCCYMQKDIGDSMKVSFIVMEGTYDAILDKNEFSQTANVRVLNSTKSSPISINTELKFQAESLLIGSVDLTSFSHFCLILGSVTSLFLQVEVFNQQY